MRLFKEYIIPRFIQWALVIFIGVTITFLVPRLSPVNPIDQALGRLTAFQSLSPEATLELRESLEALYGLEGSFLDQYIGFWDRVIRGDLGPSFVSFPMTVNQMIRSSIGWTLGLMGMTVMISWFLGVILGSLGAYRPNRWSTKIVENILIVMYPVPYYIVAFLLLMLFTFYWPVFPLVGGSKGSPEFSFGFFRSLIHHSFLPALSIIIGATAFRYIMAKALASVEVSSDYMQYAELAALPKHRILRSYLIRNTMLPQVTDLGLSLGLIFSGALITEVVFGYPGLGYTLYTGIISADYNLIMGITLLSIVGIATASLIVDLTYPLLDPRIRYK